MVTHHHSSPDGEKDKLVKPVRCTPSKASRSAGMLQDPTPVKDKGGCAVHLVPGRLYNPPQGCGSIVAMLALPPSSSGIGNWSAQPEGNTAADTGVHPPPSCFLLVWAPQRGLRGFEWSGYKVGNRFKHACHFLISCFAQACLNSLPFVLTTPCLSPQGEGGFTLLGCSFVLEKLNSTCSFSRS